MAAIFAFTCSCCGQIHEGSPSFAFHAPDPYESLTDAEKASIGELSDDFCTITRDQGTDYFVRAVLEVPIHGVEGPFLWGIWVSASEASFDRYRKTFESPAHGDGFFGWLANRIPGYAHSRVRPSNVYLQQDGQRPKVVLHRKNGSEDDPLVIDQTHGISVARAQALAEQALHRS